MGNSPQKAALRKGFAALKGTNPSALPFDKGRRGIQKMSYVHKLINDDEKLVGIARLHWIYVVQGLVWFFTLAGSGFLLSWLMNRGMGAMMRMSDNSYIPAPM